MTNRVNASLGCSSLGHMRLRRYLSFDADIWSIKWKSQTTLNWRMRIFWT